MNELTRILLEQGYSAGNKPGYAINTSDGFEYTFEFIKKMVWEAPCGKVHKQINLHDTHFNNFHYCNENHKNLFSCPTYHCYNCNHKLKGFPIGINCECTLSDIDYDYENSLEKLWDYYDEQNKKYYTTLKVEGYCVNVKDLDYETLKAKTRFDVENCIAFKCQNEICVIRNKPRDLTKVNIFYDRRIKKTYSYGLMPYTQESCTKGIKVFPKGIAKTDAEIWLRIYETKKKKLQQDEKRLYTKSKSKYEHFSYYHKLIIDGVETEYIEIIENMRIAKQEGKNILEDLEDIANGVDVKHQRDIEKSKKAVKKQQKDKREEIKQRKKQKLNQKKLSKYLFGDKEVKMLNKEKYIDVIIEDVFGVCCDNKVIQMVIGECDENMSCTECFGKVVK